MVAGEGHGPPKNFDFFYDRYFNFFYIDIMYFDFFYYKY